MFCDKCDCKKKMKLIGEFKRSKYGMPYIKSKLFECIECFFVKEVKFDKYEKEIK